jgi:hypothetical protein
MWLRGHSRKRFSKKEFFPRGRGLKKTDTTPIVLNCPRERARHSGKAFSSARDLPLGEGLFLMRSVPGRTSPSVVIGEVFPECFGVFSECI